MAQPGMRTYLLGYNRLRRGLHTGFALTGGGALTLEPDCLSRHCFLLGLDSAVDDCPWGRLALDADLAGDVVFTLRAFASNRPDFLRRGEVTAVDDFLLDPTVPPDRKERLFLAGKGAKWSGERDVVLHGQTGRYLWLWLEVTGTGTGRLSNLRVYTPGDNFFDTFPQVYRSGGGFFHRYLSIFSTLHNDLQEKIDNLHRNLDVDTAPAEVLPILADWLGLRLDGNLLDEKDLRRLLKNAFPLISTKGTRGAVEGVVRLFVEEPIYIVERNLLSRAQREGSGDLYGATPFDFTILINRRSDERLRAKLRFLVDQFKPARSRANLVFLGDCGGLDAFAYLDINGAVLQSGPGSLDDGKALTGMTYLE